MWNNYMAEISVFVITFALVVKSTLGIIKGVKVMDVIASTSDHVMGVAWFAFAVCTFTLYISTVNYEIPVWGWCLLVAGTAGNLQLAIKTYYGHAIP